jgi:hypothetical protein
MDLSKVKMVVSGYGWYPAQSPPTEVSDRFFKNFEILQIKKGILFTGQWKAA